MSPKFQLFGTVYSKGTGSEPVRITRDNELHVEPTFALYKSLAVATSRQDEQHTLDEAESKKHRTIGVWHDWLLELEGERPRWSPHIVIDVSDLSDSEIDAVKSIAAGWPKTLPPSQSERPASVLASMRAWITRDNNPVEARYESVLRQTKTYWECMLEKHNIDDVRVTLESIQKVQEVFASAGSLPTPGTVTANVAAHATPSIISGLSQIGVFNDFVARPGHELAARLVSSGYPREEVLSWKGKSTMKKDWLSWIEIEELVSKINAESQ